ncbi:type IV toxin-antitoxin system AbiEi family antitoxin domain-containing protein [Coxiella burnetii]|uniref:type IV toxin-antitoxin system AbiEi family antitoxin domain-containing protein n=1 Tax=Coxiella burnetii TaxID=777 RepID=UPI0000ECFE97|nr:hypothetical protein [Coxiella burnetii]ACJ19897.1 hypothetical protein CbuK_0634 [Coxiella burnetii CbuK_Q154]AIT62917.1 hypothetical protein CBNA_0596 [Coxiella burnetii str. Namibia]ATN85352.1 hypothetical protein AYO29_01970 [Coxiella burnetii str. Schperling]EAX32062.1 hypothetical protein A35_03145 [Coxiella burnetii 'MSU Goat Q177']EDR35165.1 conserved hypothetical protein [Coxiella burnetii Q321]
MKIEALRKLAGKEEIDYPFILSALKEYARPRDKISGWLKSGELIRIKKGLYVFGKSVALQPYSKEVLANLVYGPSAISLTYALSYYGLIPERVDVVTSVTNNRIKSFSTSIGEFKYYYLHPKKYAVGIVLNSVSKEQSFLIGSPEKALCDQIHIIDKDYPLSSIKDMEKYLLGNLRMDAPLLFKFKLKNLKEIINVYNDPRLDLLYDIIKARK